MGVTLQALRGLFPPGSAWRLPGNLGLLVEGLAVSLETARVFIRGVIAESVPFTAVAMLQEWHAALGMRYDATQSTAFLQRMLDAVQTAVGNTTLNQLNAQLRKELPNVTVTEVSADSESGSTECGVEECGAVEGAISPFIYQISGTVENDAEELRVASVLSRFAPTHLQPYSVLVNLSANGSAEAGLDTCGLTECGYAP